MTAHGSRAESPASQRVGAGPTLRPYQLQGLAAITDELETKGHRSTLLVQATGTGKTVVFSERTRRTKSYGGRVLILAHRDELLTQARRKLEAVGIHADVEKGKQRASSMAKVVLASVQSLRGARLTRFARDHFAEIVIDEAHHATAPGYRAVFDHFVDAKLLGVTATPDRADGAALGDVFDSVAFRYEMREAIRDGFLVPIKARRIVVESVDLSTVATRAGDLAQNELAAVMETERAIRGVVMPLLDLALDRPTVLFGVDVAHARLLAERLNEQRPGSARWVSGETSDTEREHTLDAFARGEFQFLANCALLTEGWDCPNVSCVAMVRPTKSRALYVQCAGRGTRLSPETGKRDLLLLDFTGTAGRHRLVGPIDCLAGSDQGVDAFADDLRAELDRLLGTQQLELESVLAKADAEVQVRRRALAIDAIVKFHAESIDPFIGQGAPLLPVEPRWEGQRPTEKQLAALDDAGVPVSKLPPSFSMADASRLLARLAQRRNAEPRLCTLAQARRIATGTGIDTGLLTFDRARELCTILREGGWRPQALRGTPEWRAAHAKLAPDEAENNEAWQRRDAAQLEHEALP